MTETKKKLFTTITTIRVLFDSVSFDQKEIFLKSLNKNPIRNVITDELFTLDSIQNENSWNEYFIYNDSVDEKKLYFINKKQISEVLNNIKACIINDMLTINKHKLN